MFIQRRYDRPEEDDFKLNVESLLRDSEEAVPQYVHVNGQQSLVGWKVQKQYE